MPLDPVCLYPWPFIYHYIMFKYKWHAFFFKKISFTIDIHQIVFAHFLKRILQPITELSTDLR